LAPTPTSILFSKSVRVASPDFRRFLELFKPKVEVEKILFLIQNWFEG
jgi:hypothetical protein